MLILPKLGSLLLPTSSNVGELFRAPTLELGSDPKMAEFGNVSNIEIVAPDVTNSEEFELHKWDIPMRSYSNFGGIGPGTIDCPPGYICYLNLERRLVEFALILNIRVIEHRLIFPTTQDLEFLDFNNGSYVSFTKECSVYCNNIFGLLHFAYTIFIKVST